MNGYALTLTTNRDFLPAELEAFAEWFRNNCDSCLMVTERGKNGRLHAHAGVTCKHKQTCGLTRAFQTVYEKLRIPFTPKISLKFKKTTEQIGWFHYLIKDIPKGEKPYLLFGWSMTWIQEQCMSNIKKIPFKLMRGDDYVMNMVVAPNLVMEHAKRMGCPLSGRESFKTVFKAMVADGYQFHNIKLKVLFTTVMMRCGNDGPLDALLDQELAFLG